jgi:hypothetical protein
MSVSIIDGTIEEAVPGRKAMSVRLFKSIVFRLADGSTKTVLKPVVHSEVAGQIQPGTSGRFYLFAAIDHRGLHGLRDDKGHALMHFPRNQRGGDPGLRPAHGSVGRRRSRFPWRHPILPGLVLLLSVPRFLPLSKHEDRSRAPVRERQPGLCRQAPRPEPVVGA